MIFFDKFWDTYLPPEDKTNNTYICKICRSWEQE